MVTWDEKRRLRYDAVSISVDWDTSLIAANVVVMLNTEIIYKQIIWHVYMNST